MHPDVYRVWFREYDRTTPSLLRSARTTRSCRGLRANSRREMGGFFALGHPDDMPAFEDVAESGRWRFRGEVAYSRRSRAPCGHQSQRRIRFPSR